jgi:hypothetical protein
LKTLLIAPPLFKKGKAEIEKAHIDQYNMGFKFERRAIS